MGDNAKALIGLGIVVVLAVVAYLAFGDNGVLAAGVVAIVGIVGIFLMQRAADKREAEEETAYLEETVGDTPAASSGAGGGGLPTWSAEPLAPWTPPEDAAPAHDEPTYTFDSALDDDGEFDTSTLDELAGFDDLDAVAEVETHAVAVDGDTGVEYEEVVEAEVEAEPVRTSLFSAPAPIREDVHSDDEILEASHATELHIGESGGGAGGNAELAKLLAKVQSRLAAYE